MKAHRWIAGLLAGLLLALPAAALAQPGEEKGIPNREEGSLWRRDGLAFCFQRQLRIGNLIIQGGGRCYNFYLFRDRRGIFLALGPGGQPAIVPGAVVPLGSSHGARLRGLLLYLIPLSGNINIAQGLIIHAPVRATQAGNKVIITLPERGVRVVLQAR